jgi:hypothetical protein
VSSNFGQSAAGFNPGGFDLNKSFTEYKFDVPSFGTGVDAGGLTGFSPGGFDLDLGRYTNFLGGGGSSIPFFQAGVDAGGLTVGSTEAVRYRSNDVGGDDDTRQALGIANTLGNYGIQAANINNMAAEVAAENAQNSLLTDYNLQRIGKGDRQRFNTNRLGRQENLMAVVPSAIANATYNTKNPNVGAAIGAQLAGMLG